MNNEARAAQRGARAADAPRRLPDWAFFLLKLGLIAALLTLTFTLVLGVHIQHGNRMHPYAEDGDLLVYFRLEEPQVGDLVVYRHPDTGQPSLSRVAALGACEVELSPSGILLINGRPQDEQVFYPTEPLEGSRIPNPCALRAGEFFLLDDYRSIGLDSRSFGPVQREDILGKVVYLFRRRGF
jgi:signal peptidase I